ncbi:MAG TPA: DNA repair protein RadC [Anaerolineales bacterium]|nr:DNA repair protein RadC [Anaerolineales bacterium]
MTNPLPRLKCLRDEERPAYRVAQNASGCNATELLAALIGGPLQIEIAESLLKQFGSLRGLHQAHVDEIAQVHGCGPQTASRIKAALGLSARVLEADEPPYIGGQNDAAALVQYEMSVLPQEELRVILLNARMRLIGIEEIYRGSVSCSQVRIGEVFRPAIVRRASSIIVAHNHPSGDPTPSPDDVALTRAMHQAGKLLDIDLLDHIIIGGNRFASLRESGLGFSHS